MKVELRVTFDRIQIFFDDKIHLMIKRNEMIGFQAWVEDGNKYCIEYYTKTNKILCEYEGEQKWSLVLNELKNKLIL